MRDPDSQPVQQRIALVVALVALVACFALLVDYTGRSTALALNRPALAARARDLVVLLLFIVSAGTLGAGLTRRAGFDVRAGTHRALVSFGLGFGAFSVVGIVLATLQLVSPVALWGLTLAPPLAWGSARRTLAADLRAMLPSSIRPTPEVVVGGVIAVFYGLLALTPPFWIDPLTYHLVIPAEYLAHGGVPGGADNLYSNFPHAMSMLYMFVMGMGSDVLPKLLHAFFLLLSVTTCFHYLSRAAGKQVATLAVLLFGCQWVVHHEIVAADVDFHFTFYGVFAFFLIADVFRDARAVDTRRAVLAGLMIGITASGKMQVVSCVAGLELLFAWLLVKKRIGLRQLAFFHLAAGLVYLPTFTRNFIYTVDPSFIALAGVLDPLFDLDPLLLERYEAVAASRGLTVPHLSLANFVAMPVFAYTDGRFPNPNFDGYIDPFYLVTILIGLVFLKRDRYFAAVYVYLFGFYCVWVLTAPVTRYAIPALPLLAFVTAATLAKLAAAAPPGGRVPLLTGARSLVLAFCVVSTTSLMLSSHRLIQFALPGFFEIATREQFYAAAWPQARQSMAVSQAMDEHEAATRTGDHADPAGVYMVLASESYFLNRPYFNDPFSVNIRLLKNRQDEGTDPVQWLREQGYGYVLGDMARVRWSRNESKTNELLPPYPEELAEFEALLQYWGSDVAPRLEPLVKEGELAVWVIPPADGPRGVSP